MTQETMIGTRTGRSRDITLQQSDETVRLASLAWCVFSTTIIVFRTCVKGYSAYTFTAPTGFFELTSIKQHS